MAMLPLFKWWSAPSLIAFASAKLTWIVEVLMLWKWHGAKVGLKWNVCKIILPKLKSLKIETHFFKSCLKSFLTWNVRLKFCLTWNYLPNWYLTYPLKIWSYPFEKFRTHFYPILQWSPRIFAVFEVDVVRIWPRCARCFIHLLRN